MLQNFKHWTLIKIISSVEKLFDQPFSEVFCVCVRENR